MTDKQQKQHDRKARQAIAKAQTNRDKARRKLLRQRKKLARRRTRNRHQSEHRRDDEADDEETENPTAHSTLPPQKSNAENAARNSHSTVPETPKYSNVQARERLYGQRLHRKTSERGDANSAPTASDAAESDTEVDKSTDE